MQRIFFAVFIVVISIGKAKSQNALPDFSVEDLGNSKVRISWTNQFGEDCIQLTVQASIDSIKNYRTIFSTESPQLPQNGFVYTLPFPAKWYYRVSYILSGNAYYFSPAKTSVPSIFSGSVINDQQMENGNINRIITILSKDSVLTQIPYTDYKRFKDSIVRNTKDTLFILSQDQILLKAFDPFNFYKPSIYVVTNPDGFIQIKLPDANAKKYKLIFFDTDGKKLFAISHITEPDLVIDKTNFLHAGWFKFELYEDDKLKERNKILLQRDF